MIRYPGLSWEIPLAGLGHVAAFAAVALARCGGTDAPLFRPEDVMVVSMSGPMQEMSRMPQKAERAPDVSRGNDAVAPPPPPNASDMALQTPDAKTKGDPNAERLREQAIADMRREQLLRDLDAPLGTVDRAQTGNEAGAGGPVTAGITDPELAKWTAEARRRVAQNWHPLTTVCALDPQLTVIVRVDVDPGGSLGSTPEVGASSGNASLDGSATRAVAMTGSLPALPAKFPDGVVANLKFVCKEALR